MKQLKYYLFLSFFLSNLALGNNQLRFIVSDPGSAPYAFYDKDSKEFKGIIPEILNELIEAKKINIKFVAYSRKGSEEYLYQSKADLMMLSKSWLKHPENVIASISIHSHRSYLYQQVEFQNNFNLSNVNEPKVLCTRKGYHYPNLTTFFEKNKLTRLDTSSYTAMLKLIFKNRCDLAVMNEYNAASKMNNPSFVGKQLFRSKLPISEVPINIILRPELINEKKLIDSQIIKLKQSGKLEQIINTHYRYKAR